MAKPSEIRPVTIEDSHLRILIAGEPGSGKSPLIGTWPNTLIAECDPGGTDSAARWGVAKNVQKWTIHDWDEMDNFYKYIRHEGYKEFDFVWIDSLSHFQELGLDDIMEDKVKAKPDIRVKWKADRGEYGDNMSRLALLCRDFRALPINFGITTHVMEFQTQTSLGDEVLLQAPAVRGKDMPARISSYFSVVSMLFRERDDDGQMRPVLLLEDIQSGEDTRLMVRDRFHLFEEGRLENPTMPKIMQAWNRVRGNGTPRKSAAVNNVAKLTPRVSTVAKKRS